MRFIIKEDCVPLFFDTILTEAFYPTADKVLAVKRYLDDNFIKNETDDIGDDGYPKKIKSAVLVNKSKQPLKTFMPKELLLLLDDKFQRMISNKDDRKKFLKQIITDWFNNKISKEGVLSVNLLK